MTEIIFDENEDWEKRVLCSDESCIGTVGPDGKCRACGKVYEGELPEILGAIADRPVYTDEQKTDPATDAEDDDDWQKRVLCIDESCIGVIGPDGKCKECGKPLS
ncbi:MAG: hypothetical protein EG826_04620 [Deltaproteobacteria bacterium]|nr:hypothetical protein [Deltaproteobacteria bacterium]